MIRYACKVSLVRHRYERMSGENGSASGLGPTNETSCYEALDSIQYKIAAALRASVGLFSFFCCLGVVLVLVLYKKYKFFTQRLVLYLTIAALVHSISYTLARVNYYTPRPIEDPYCYFGGLLNHYTAAVELLNIWCITFNLFVNTIFNKRTEKLEVIYFLISYFLPVTWFWLPLWKGAYGTAGPWCGIRTVDANCNPFPFGIERSLCADLARVDLIFLLWIFLLLLHFLLAPLLVLDRLLLPLTKTFSSKSSGRPSFCTLDLADLSDLRSADASSTWILLSLHPVVAF